MKARIIALMAAGLLFLGTTAYGVTTTATLQVSGTVAAAVTVSTTPVDFGDLAGTGSATGSISVTAATGTAYSIALDAGQHYSTADGSRQIYFDVSNALNYGLKQPDNATNWGDDGTTTPASWLTLGSLTGDGLAQSYTVYASTAALGGTEAPGTYTDTVTVTVTY